MTTPWGLALALATLATADLHGQTILTVAGDGVAGFDGEGGRADTASFLSPSSVVTDPSGQIFIADTGNHRIRRVTFFLDNTVTHAGTGTAGFSGNGGPAISAQLNGPADVFVDTGGVTYIADTGNHVIRRVTTAGMIYTVAGTATIAGNSGDSGAATSAKLNSPTGVFVTAAGEIFIADRDNHKIRHVSIAGTITTYAGTGTAGFSGDGGTAASAQLNRPSDVFVDTAGVVYITDTDNHRIRVIAADSTIGTLAGTGIPGFSGDGDLATNAQLSFPRAVYVDSSANVYIADRFNHRVRRVHSSGNITTLAGDGALAFSGDKGAANLAQLGSPSGVWRREGDLLIADAGNHRIRRIFDDNLVGLSGTAIVGPNREVQLLSVGFTGDGSTGIKSLSATVSDCTSTTGLDITDFAEFRLYESADSLLSNDDILLGTLSPEQMPIDSTFVILADVSSIPGLGEARHYLLTVVIATDAVEGHAFRVAFPRGGLSTSIGSHAEKIVASDANSRTIDIVASRMEFTTQPDGSFSGNPLIIQPVITAFDDSGFVDTDFNDIITLTLGGGASGTLLQVTATADSGIATFSNVTYTALTDQERFSLVADDEAGGGGGDLTAVTSNSLESNSENDLPTVVALAFVIDEDDSITVPIQSMVFDRDDSLETLAFSFNASNTTASLNGFDLTIRPDPDFFGLDTLVITVTDPFGGQNSDLCLLQIDPVNDAPSLELPPSSTIFEDEILELNLEGFASDKETLFSDFGWLFTRSAGLQTAYSQGEGILRAWTTADSFGTFTLTVTVFDNNKLPAIATTVVLIASANDPPILNLPSASGAPGKSIVFNLNSFTTDVDHNLADLTYAITASQGLTALATASVASVTPNLDFEGTGFAVYQATDPNGGVGFDTLFVNVEDVPNTGDFNGDDRIDFGDFFRFGDHFGLSVFHAGWDPIYDLDDNGRVDFDDFFLFVDLFNGTTSVTDP
ncbi:MAG: Ig-like domain-containing protein [Candidatus Latescibacterota bacterium]|nr:Ig-like domain-containing protein [Candidatus Latescibacterota bacterium]